MPWQPLPRIAFAVATYPFAPSSPADLPLEIGDELYVIEETPGGEWLRGYLVAPPSLLAGLTSIRGQTLEARVFSGIFPRSCVEIRELLGDSERGEGSEAEDIENRVSVDAELTNGVLDKDGPKKQRRSGHKEARQPLQELRNVAPGALSIPVKRDPDAPRPAAPVPMLKIGDETPTSASEPLIDEIASCLREWHSKNLHELLLSRQYAQLDKLSQLITGLNLSRQQFLYNVLTAHEYDRLREKTVWDLVRVNKLCGGEVIVRDPKARGRVLTGDDSVVEVTKLQSVMSLLDEPPQPAAEMTSVHQLLVEIKGFAGASTEDTTLVAYLVSKPPYETLTNLSECFTLDIPHGGSLGSLSQTTQTKTLFTDLSSQDIGEGPTTESELYLVVKVLASQQVSMHKPASRSGTGQQNGYSRETSNPMSPGGTKSSRRSLMWGATKSTRSAFSRGGQTSRMDAVNEQGEERPSTNGSVGARPPSTAGSRNAAPVESLQTVQRTVGLGVLKLNAIMKQSEEVEQVVNVWAPSTKPLSDRDPGDDWDPLVRDLMDSPTSNFEKAKRGERLQLHLKAFNHPDADALIKATPTMLSGVTKTSRMGFSGAPTRPRSDIYLTLNTAALARQNLLSRYGGSATAMPATVAGNHLQVTLEVRRATGERIDNCIYVSSSTDPISTFKSTAAERGESWKQTVRLHVSPNDVSTSHVVMFLSDVPNPPFAVAHMPLWDKQAFIHDGSHGLLLYKIDEYTSTPLAGPAGKGGYLSLPFSPRGKDEHSAEVTGPLAVMLVETYLSSTRFSQDRIILGLLRWKDLPKEDVPAMLRQLIFVPEIEVVKLLSDVLDGLFGILVEFSGNDDYEDLVFTALVRVLGIVHDRRFNLGPLVDQYAEKKFNYPFATPCLVRSFTRLLENPTEPETARKLRATFKVVRHILKFITHARGQQKAKEAGIGITSSAQGFTRHLRSIFKALDEMMRNSSPVLVGSQTLAVQHFHTWLPELAGLLSTEEILHIAIDFMDSCKQVKGKLVLYKLILIINYSKLDLFAQREQKAALSANTVRWITPHWGYAPEVNDQWREQIRLCCSVLASQIGHLGPEIPDHIPRIIDSYVAIQSSPQKERNRLSLLFPTSYPFPSKTVTKDFAFDEALVELSAILSALSNSKPGMQLELAEDDLTALLENLLQVEMSILVGEAFPAEWLSVHIYHHKSIMRTLQYLAGILLDSFLPDPDDAEEFNTDLWKAFFTTLLKLVGSSSLALETFPEQKRRAVWKIAGDVREHGAELLRRTWEAIGWESSAEEQNRYGLVKMGGYQVSYVPTLVGPIVELCLSVHEGLRKMAVEVLQTMIVSEWTLSEDLSAIQTEMIDCLDEFFKTKPLTESILQKLFIGELMARFEPLSEIPDEPLYAALRELVATLDEFLDLLAAVHSGDNTHEASHIINRLRLMEFLRDMQKEEIFVRYVHQLADLQAETRNYAGAGLALRLHADLYEWDPTRQCTPLPETDCPAQTAFERKESIYFSMIKHFEDGESWSNALTAYKELQAQYETNIFDFAKLARTERAIATIYETISKSDRLVAKYFKVIYKGLGFPASVRDKEFIYEGSPTERASVFTDRMQEQYPAAHIVTSGDVDEVEGQYLVVSAVTPHRDLTHHVFQRARVPQVIRDFLLSSHPQVFSMSTKRHTSGPVHEHYAEKLVYTTEEPFPTIMRRSEIVEIAEIRLTAHETALERIVRKTQEMAALERRISEGEEDHVPTLVDAIYASVNPNSESSVICYRELLPAKHRGMNDNEDAERDGMDEDEDEEEEEDDEEPELEPQDSAIKMALIDHALVIKRCLAAFSRSTNEVLLRRHEDLQQGFQMTFAPEISTFAPPPVPTPREALSTPSPKWRRSPTVSDRTPPHANIASALNASAGEQEASVLRPVSLYQRGPTLSVLGSRRKESDPTRGVETTNGTTEPMPPRQRAGSKDTARRSLVRNPIVDVVSNGESAGSDWGSSLSLRKSADKTRVSEIPPKSAQEQQQQQQSQGALGKRGSVRKRLSMLRIGGGGPKKGSNMGSLDEE